MDPVRLFCVAAVVEKEVLAFKSILWPELIL